MRQLFAELNSLLQQGQPLVYCSVVETRGSTPQKAGAAMLVLPDGSQRGTLGGGCVEAEVKQRALAALRGSGQAEIVTYNLDDDYGWDDGLICGGRMTMLVQPVQSADPAVRTYHRQLLEILEKGHGCTEAVLLKDQSDARLGSRFLFSAAGEPLAALPTGAIPPGVTEGLKPLAQRPTAGTHQGVAYLPILPRITLLIVGGGHVGQAVARLASEVDFDVWVLDDRERFANRERFPTATHLLVGDIGATLKTLAKESLSPAFYCIIVTRGHHHDEEALCHLATAPTGYLGMIGSKRKIRLIYEDLIAKGIPPETLERVHAPLGFEIGSQTVPEIAVSIVAELIAQRNLGSTRVPERVRVQAGNVR